MRVFGTVTILSLVIISLSDGATLLHRYSFNSIENLQDSIGSDHGTAQGVLTYTNGKVVLSGGPYITLNRAATVLGSADAVTIDMWVDIHPGNTMWTKLFQFGSNGEYFIFTALSSLDN